MIRTEAREIAFKMLFSNNYNNDGFDIDTFTNILQDEEKKSSQKDLDFIKSLVLGVIEHKDEIIQIISRNLNDYTFERIFSVDRVALMLCTYELKYNKETPFKVAINETLNLVKKYSTEKSASFVNSVLDKVYKEIANE